MDNKTAYNEWAAIYDNNKNKTRDLDALITQEILAKYAFQDVLEIGCGTGKNTKWLAKTSKNIWAMDFSGAMLAHLKRKLKEFPIEIIEADIRKNWPIETTRVDLVLTNLVLEHIQDLGFIFEEAHRVLRSKGKFFISELHPFKQYVGSKARFDQAAKTIELDCFVHHISEFMDEAKQAGFHCLELKEWFDEGKKTGVPRLVSFIFEKS